MGLRLRIKDVWRGVLYGTFLGAGLKISAKPISRDGEMDLSKDGH